LLSATECRHVSRFPTGVAVRGRSKVEGHRVGVNLDPIISYIAEPYRARPNGLAFKDLVDHVRIMVAAYPGDPILRSS
jgi:hypothetical protein